MVSNAGRDKKEIALIIPVFNVEKYIKELIDSLKCQTNKNFRVYFLDDNSDDNSCEYIENHMEEDWLLARNDERMGAALTRNKGIELSTEKYIHCIDADDVIESTFIEELYTCINEYNPEIIMLERDFFKDGEKVDVHKSIRKIYPQGIYNANTLGYCLYTRAKVATMDVCISRNFINKYGIRFQDLSSSNDVFFILFSMMMAEKIVHVNSYYPLYHTRIHFSESRISSHRDPMNAYLALQKVKDELENVGKLKSQGKYFWEYALMSMQDQLNKCRDEERRKEVLSFLKSQGFNQMGVGSSLYEEAVPQAFKDQYNKFCELETTNPAMKQSMYMEGLCFFSEDKIVDFVNTMKNENKTTGFWGLGSFSKGFIEIVQKNSLSLDYYFDNNPESGKKYNISVLDYKSIDASPDVIVISTTQYFSEIADIISDRNPNTKVICMEDILYDGIS